MLVETRELENGTKSDAREYYGRSELIEIKEAIKEEEAVRCDKSTGERRGNFE